MGSQQDADIQLEAIRHDLAMRYENQDDDRVRIDMHDQKKVYKRLTERPRLQAVRREIQDANGVEARLHKSFDLRQQQRRSRLSTELPNSKIA